MKPQTRKDIIHLSFIYGMALFILACPTGILYAQQYPDTYRDHCSYHGAVPPGGLCGQYQTRNLITEDASFELGIEDNYDAVSTFRRMYYRQYNPGSGDIFSSDPLRGYIKPTVTPERYHAGDPNNKKSLKIYNPRNDGIYVNFNWVRVPITGRYVFSAWMKAENLQGGNSNILTNFEIYGKDANRVVEGIGDCRVYPSSWTRKYVYTQVLQAGEYYRPLIRMGSYVHPDNYANGTLYIDEAQFELAVDQDNPAPTDFAYSTSQAEMFAYTSPEASGTTIKRGNTYFIEDAETIFAHVQIKEINPLPQGAKIKWQLYDIYSDSNNPMTALATGETAVAHTADNFQTVHMDISSILAAVPLEKLHGLASKQKGLFKMSIELWQEDTQMLDKEFLVFGKFAKSPYIGQNLPNSFFANHVGLDIIFNTRTDTDEFHGVHTSRPPDEYWQLAEKLGVKASREFGFISQGQVQGQHDSDPFFDDYLNEAKKYHIDLMPVIGQRVNNPPADSIWQEYVAELAQHFGTNIKQYEVLNEPHDGYESWYYDYLWKAEEAIHAVDPSTKVLGPSSSYNFARTLLSYTDGTHLVGYDLIDNFAPHIYFEFRNGMSDTPEGLQGGTSVDEHLSRWKDILDEAAPEGRNQKPLWVTEFSLSHSRIYDDIPVVFGKPGWGDPVMLHPFMSGSLAMSKKIAADIARYYLYQIANKVEKSFYFGMFSTWVTDGALYAMFDYDGTPFEDALAYAQMTRYLEGARFIRRIEAPDLRTNGILSNKSRVFIFETPDLNNPGQFLPLAVAFNWDQEQSGAQLQNVPLNPVSDVDCMDIEGNPISLPANDTFDLPIDMAPKYIIGKNAIDLSAFVLALDKIRPTRPSRPSAIIENGTIKITWMQNLEKDVDHYDLYRKEAQETQDTYVASIPKDGSLPVIYYDVPPAGSWQYDAKAVESGTGYQTPPSPYSNPVSLDFAPVLGPIGDQNGVENQPLSFTVSATDENPQDQLHLTASNLPEGATFTDHGDRTATFSWTPADGQARAYPYVHFEVTDGQAIDSEDITITIVDTNEPPVLSSIGNKTVDEGQLLEFTVTATDPNAGDHLSFNASPLPEGATFTDQGNRTATFSWTPTYDQARIYPNIHFEVSDGSLSDFEDITITVNNVDRTAPVISQVRSFPLINAVFIWWTTDEPADSQIEYGLTTQYGQSTPMDTQLVTSHLQAITGLRPNTVYHFRVKSKDAQGNPAVSQDFNFRTKRAAPSVTH